MTKAKFTTQLVVKVEAGLEAAGSTGPFGGNVYTRQE